MGKMTNVLLHIGVVCSFACVIAKILDWYNPYMDFSGHIVVLQIVLCITMILLPFSRRKNRKKHHRNEIYFQK